MGQSLGLVRVGGQSSGEKSGSGVRVWSLGQSLGQSLGPESGVWVRVLGQSLGSGPGFGAKVWSLGQSLGLARVGGQSLGQSLVSEFESECGIKLN